MKMTVIALVGEHLMLNEFPDQRKHDKEQLKSVRRWKRKRTPKTRQHPTMKAETAKEQGKERALVLVFSVNIFGRIPDECHLVPLSK